MQTPMLVPVTVVTSPGSSLESYLGMAPGQVDALLPLIAAAWTFGVLFLTLRLVGGGLTVRIIRRGAVVLSVPPGWAEKTGTVARALGVARRVTIGISSAVDVPTVIGWMRPLILVPASTIAGLSPFQFEAILAHELAHIRRHDYLVNVLQNAAETLLFYHPAVWWLSNRVRAEREHCCDDVAVEYLWGSGGICRRIGVTRKPPTAGADSRARRKQRRSPHADSAGARRSGRGDVVAINRRGHHRARTAGGSVRRNRDTGRPRRGIAQHHPHEAHNLITLDSPSTLRSGQSSPELPLAAPELKRTPGLGRGCSAASERRYAASDRHAAERQALRAPRDQLEARAAAPAPQTIAVLEEQLRTARVSKDATTLARLLDTEFTGTDSAGATLNRTQALEEFRGRSIRSITIKLVSGSMLEKTAFATGIQTEVTNAGSAAIHFTRVWTNTAAGWKLLRSVEFRPLPASAALPPGTPFRVGGDIKEPRLLTPNVKPIYPPAAKAAGQQGMVIIEATIDPQGNVVNARVIKAAQPELDRAALEAVSRWVLLATLLAGTPISVLLNVSVNFALQ